MLFSSSVFLIFFLPAVLTLYYIIPRRCLGLRNLLLLLASLGFYAWGEPKFIRVMLLSILGNYVFGLLADRYREDRRKARLVLAAMLVFNLSIIFVNKYLMFVLENLNRLPFLSFEVPLIRLPIGISFFTFQSISYVIDIYRGHGTVQKNPLNVGLYISFFPQLIAGPIVRYQTVAEQILERHESWDGFSSGVCRFIRGLGKKILLSNTLAIVADRAFDLGPTSVAFAWLGAFCYTMQIFFDFSGYSDMAIGLGRMFGFRFEENFNYPYISRTVSEFWRRWHISLGSWFRDYVYIPLGGNRGSRKRQIFNLFVVWLLTGIWHGANWTFICWGLYFFVLLTFEKTFRIEKRNLPRLPQTAITFLLALCGWVLFRAENLSAALEYFSAMFGGAGLPLVSDDAALLFRENLPVLAGAVLFSCPVGQWLKAKLPALNKVYGLVYPLVYILLFLVSVSYIVKGTYNPFIYFNF